jgi:hypothetical protein
LRGAIGSDPVDRRDSRAGICEAHADAMGARADVPQFLLRVMQAIEPGLWIVFAIALLVFSVRRIWRGSFYGGKRMVAAVAAVAAGLRVAVPFAPTNWYFGLANTALGRQLYTRSTTYLPLPNRWVIFDLAGGSRAIAALNLVLGTAAIICLWYASARSNHTPRTSFLFAVLIALVPVYVRYAGSDASHTMLLFLYSCAAAAFTDLATGEGGAPAYTVLFFSTVLAFPIRAESSVVFLAIPFFLMNGRITLRDVVRGRHKALAVLVSASLVGILELVSVQAESIRAHAHWDLGSLSLALLSRLLVLVSPLPVSFFPAVLSVPIWVYVASLAKRRAWRELASIYVPILSSGAPAVFGGGVFLDLPSAGYQIVSVLFIVLACARATDHFWTKLERRELVLGRWQRILLLGAVPLVVASFVFPWWRTYAYQEEYRFLRDALPRERATILTIWDPEAHAGDFDCCLAMPYPTLWIEHRNLRWLVLGKTDLPRVRALRFDYYYPGSMASIDIRSLDSWRGRLVVQDDARRLAQRNHLEAIARLDEAIRREHALTPIRSVTVRANTFSSVAFAGDRATFTLYARRASAARP